KESKTNLEVSKQHMRDAAEEAANIQRQLSGLNTDYKNLQKLEMTARLKVEEAKTALDEVEGVTENVDPESVDPESVDPEVEVMLTTLSKAQNHLEVLER